MLNKEMLLNSMKKDEPHVIVTDNVMNRKPYWHANGKGVEVVSIKYYRRQGEWLTRIGADVASKATEDFHIEATCLENGVTTDDMTFAGGVFGDDLAAYIAYTDVFGLENGPKSFVFTPPDEYY